MKKLILALAIILSPCLAGAQAVVNLSQGLNILAVNSPTSTIPFFYTLNFPSNAVSLTITAQPHTSLGIAGGLTATYTVQQNILIGPTSGSPSFTPTCTLSTSNGTPITTTLVVTSIMNLATLGTAVCPAPSTGSASLAITGTANGASGYDLFVIVSSVPANIPCTEGTANVAGNCASMITPIGVSGGTVGLIPVIGDTAGNLVNSKQVAATDSVANSATVVPIAAQGASNNLIWPQFYFTGIGAGAWDRTTKCNTAVAISVAAAATQQLVAPVAGQKVRICGMFLSVSTGGTLSFTEGTGATCATGPTTIGGPMTLPVGMSPIMSGGTTILQTNVSGDGFCLVSGTAAVQGWAETEQH